ncbi:hypothetical protein BJX99DRAFT_234358 [Aspergillus californicus]
MDSAPGSNAFSPSDSDGATLAITPLALARMSASDVDRESDVSIKKRKRVRTGCFTCRDRHLKCDEAQGQCQNCQKSGRSCRRGVRLNFVDTQVVEPPTCLQPPAGVCVTFRDDSRTIASEYVGGFERYPPPEPEPPLEVVRQISTPVQSYPSEQITTLPLFNSTSSSRHLSLNDPTELSLIQMFVEKIAPWLDIVDDSKHFTRILPFHVLEEPILYAAFAACALGLPGPTEGRYNTAVQMLAGSLGGPHRDSALCAASAVIIEVAETLALGPDGTGRIQHASPARSLIRECQWNTRTQGLGGACSWLNILSELLGCLLSPGRTLTWDPDTWGIDMNFAQTQPSHTGNEELWTQRMIYICGKVLDFRSSSEPQPAGRGEITQRSQDWNLYNEWCDKWLVSVPRSMLPLGQLQPWQRSPQCVFPQVWLLERSAVVAQMLYHVTRIILIKTDPIHNCLFAMQQEQQRHAYNVCGIVSSDRNPGIPIFSVQLLTVAAEFLLEREAREEVLTMLDQIWHETGLKTQQVKERLLEMWSRSKHHGHVHQLSHSTLDTTMVSSGFDTSTPDHDFLTDPFTDAFTETHAYLDPHLYHQS